MKRHIQRVPPLADPHCRPRARRRGTTFVELLVALAMLAVLVPALSGAFQVARRLEGGAARDAEAIALAENQWAQLRGGLLVATAVEDEPLPDPWSDYRWSLRLEAWSDSDACLATVLVRDARRRDSPAIALSGLLPVEGSP